MPTLTPMPPSRPGDPGSGSATNNSGGTQPGPGNGGPQGDQVEQANAAAAPIEFDIHVKAVPSEIQDAIALLQEAGLKDLAASLEQALQPPSEDEQAAQGLSDDVEAASFNPHSQT